MMEDERGKKLLSNLKAAFARDPNIVNNCIPGVSIYICRDSTKDEYDFLPVLEPKHNCNPLVLVDHKLGVEIWASKVLFDYAYQRLIHWRRRLPQARDIDPNGLLNLTRAVLMFNPDNATAWNVRKELVQAKVLPISEDLCLGSLILTKHPKSPETFAHRKWLLLQRKAKLLKRLATVNGTEPNSNINDNQNPELKGSDTTTTTTSDGLRSSPGGWRSCSRLDLPVGFALHEQVRAEVRREVEVAAGAAEKYANNYNAWSHRIWVLQQFTDNHHQVLTSELQQTEGWMARHVSDYGGFHYRQYLLTSLGSQHEQLNSELTLITDLIETFPGHEALWCHRRAVVRALLSRPLESCSASRKVTTNQAAKKTRVQPHRDMMLEQEEDFCTSIAETCKDNWQRTLMERYRSWLKKTFSN